MSVGVNERKQRQTQRQRDESDREGERRSLSAAITTLASSCFLLLLLLLFFLDRSGYQWEIWFLPNLQRRGCHSSIGALFNCNRRRKRRRELPPSSLYRSLSLPLYRSRSLSLYRSLRDGRVCACVRASSSCSPWTRSSPSASDERGGREEVECCCEIARSERVRGVGIGSGRSPGPSPRRAGDCVPEAGPAARERDPARGRHAELGSGRGRAAPRGPPGGIAGPALLGASGGRARWPTRPARCPMRPARPATTPACRRWPAGTAPRRRPGPGRMTTARRPRRRTRSRSRAPTSSGGRCSRGTWAPRASGAKCTHCNRRS